MNLLQTAVRVSVLAIIVAVIVMVLSRLNRVGCTDSVFRERSRSFAYVQHALLQYQADHGQFAYSPQGSGPALLLALRGLGDDLYLPHVLIGENKLLQHPSDIPRAYEYLNPKPGQHLAPDTIVLVETVFFSRGKGLFVAMASGRREFCRRVREPSRDLLGRRLEELDVTFQQ